MRGPSIVARSFVVRGFGRSGYRAQYHQQSDAHSKVASWAVLFDLLLESPIVRQHAAAGTIGFGVNHEMSDYRNARRKNLDLVIATPGSGGPVAGRTLVGLAATYGVVLDDEDRAALASLPTIHERVVGSVLVAVEAKAAMTAHVKALPRLYDELNSSQLTVHGAADPAIAVGVILVNAAEQFLAYDRNRLGLDTPTPSYNLHRQPADALRTIAKIEELPRRTKPGESGFDALGIVVLAIANDGTPVRLLSESPAPSPTSDYEYAQMIRRVAAEYAFRFGRL
jgi:hypothetical protein